MLVNNRTMNSISSSLMQDFLLGEELEENLNINWSFWLWLMYSLHLTASMDYDREYKAKFPEEFDGNRHVLLILPQRRMVQVNGLGYARAIQREVDPYGYTSLELLDHLNSGEVILVRTNSYMEKARTIGQFYFFNGVERVEVKYTFPLVKAYFDIWKKTNGKGMSWEVVDPTAFKHAYALPFQETDRAVTGNQSSWWKPPIPTLNGVDMEDFDPAKHRITMSVYPCYHPWTGEEDGYRTDFDIGWEVILSQSPIDLIVLSYDEDS